MFKILVLAGAIVAACLAAAPANAQRIQIPGQPPNDPPPQGPAPGGQAPGIRPNQPSGPGQPGQGGQRQLWGALAFTSDGSYSTVSRAPSKAEAEAEVAKRCARFGRGPCEVVSVPGELCVALASYRGGRWRIAFSAGGRTYPEAQENALDRCRKDRRTRARRCEIRIALCGDGR